MQNTAAISVKGDNSSPSLENAINLAPYMCGRKSQVDMPFSKPIRLGSYLRGERYLVELNRARPDMPPCRVTPTAESILMSRDFKSAKQAYDTTMVNIPLSYLGLKSGGGIGDVFNAGASCGLRVSPLEVGPAARLLLAARSSKIPPLYIASEPMRFPDGSLRIMFLTFDGKDRLLDTVPVHDMKFGPSDRFIFLKGDFKL